MLSDFKSYFRFSIPRIELSLVPQEARTLAGGLASMAPDDVVRDLKLFACRVRTAITEEAQEIVGDNGLQDHHRAVDLVEAYLASCSDALAAMRDVLGPLKLRNASFERPHPEIVKTVAWVDEYLSRVLESSLINVVNALESVDGPQDAARVAVAAAVDEARYRRSRNEGPVSSEGGSVEELEHIERRQHALKRFTSSVLWLDVDIREEYSVALHVVSALAAGIAMTFAVVIAVLFGQPNVPGQLGVWAAVVIAAYMGKDRLKAVLQTAFDSLVASRVPDRRWTVRMPGTTSVLADVAERAGFVDRHALPDTVDLKRSVAHRDRLQELAGPESILWHRKTVVLRADAMRTGAPDFAALTDVMRVDVSRWLTHTDDAKRVVSFADPDDGQLFESKLPRAYDVTVVYRLAHATADDTDWHVTRIVVSRNGIRRVVPLKEV